MLRTVLICSCAALGACAAPKPITISAGPTAQESLDHCQRSLAKLLGISVESYRASLRVEQERYDMAVQAATHGRGLPGPKTSELEQCDIMLSAMVRAAPTETPTQKLETEIENSRFETEMKMEMERAATESELERQLDQINTELHNP